MFYPWMMPLLAAIALLWLAIVAGRNARRTELAEAFVFLAITMCFWNLNFFVLYYVEDYDLASKMSRTLRTGTLFLPPAILHMFLALTPDRPASWKRFVAADYAVGAILALMNSADLLVAGLRHFAWGYASVGTNLYHLFTAFALVNCVTALFVLGHDYVRSTEPRMRQQLSFWVAGTFLAIPLGLTNLLPAYGVSVYPPGNLGTALWAGVVAYAIVRHRLMDIELVLSKGLAYLAVVVLWVGPMGALVVALHSYTFGRIDYDLSAILVVLFVVTGIIFPKVQLYIETRIESSLLHRKLKARAVLSTFARVVVRMLDQNKITEEVVLRLDEAFSPSNLELYIFEPDGRLPTLCGSTGIAQSNQDPLSPEFLTWVRRLDTPILVSEVDAFAEHNRQDSRVISVMRSRCWDVIVPLAAGDSTVGFVCLGRKSSLDAYSVGDLEVLETLGAQASIALQNAALHKQLRQSQEIIARADRLSALGTLAAGIAHEIRNPLVSIQTFFQLAPGRLDDEEFMTSFLGLADKEVARIRNLISDLLSYAKASDPEIVEVDLGETVDRAMGLLSPHAHERRVELRSTGTTGLSMVQADPDQVLQALLNIVLNAIDASPTGGAVSLDGQCSSLNGSEYVSLLIKDAGAGIAKEKQEAIFDPFFTTKDKGTGLGLAISHRIISDLGGYLSVDSNEGQGSTFTIGLPVSPGSSKSTKREYQSNHSTP